MKILISVPLIHVTPMPHVPTMLVHLCALVMLATLVTALTALMIMNAMMVLITAMQMLLAPTFQDHSNAHVTSDTQAMELTASIITNVLPIT